MNKNILRSCLLICFMVLTQLARAHRPNQSYIFLDIYEDSLQVSYEILIKDLNNALNVNLPTVASRKDIEPLLEQILSYYRNEVKFFIRGKEYIPQFDNYDFFSLSQNDNYLVLNYMLNTGQPAPDSMSVYYNVLLEKDATHSGYVIIRNNWKEGVLNQETNIVLGFEEPRLTKVMSLNKGSVLTGFWMMIKQGMLHIWIGIDHILFLLALMLPAVMTYTLLISRRKRGGELVTYSKMLGFLNGRARYTPSFRPAFIYVIKIITFFTIAHTITLTLASLQIINLPDALVESIIAISIVIAGIHNIYPLFKGPDWVIAFVFGLFHGFGFANVLADLGLRGSYMTYTLLGFNLGVELGQIVILAILFPILFFIRRISLYPKIYVGITLFIIIIAMLWFLNRAFGLPDITSEISNYIAKLLIDG